MVCLLQAIEKYGRTELENIAKEVDSKSFEEVKAYSEKFWDRFDELQDSEKILNQIEKVRRIWKEITSGEMNLSTNSKCSADGWEGVHSENFEWCKISWQFSLTSSLSAENELSIEW